MIDEFKAELKALLEKYGADIYLSREEGTGEEMRTTLGNGTDHFLSWGYGLDASDLKKREK
jgi:hypothetical protein